VETAGGRGPFDRVDVGGGPGAVGVNRDDARSGGIIDGNVWRLRAAGDLAGHRGGGVDSGVGGEIDDVAADIDGGEVGAQEQRMAGVNERRSAIAIAADERPAAE